MVDHHILLCKLEQIGLGDTFVQWIADYLTDPKQVTRVNNVVSSEGILTCGVPQGPILGPLLLITYINSLPGIIPPNVSTYLYADDTAIVARGQSAHKVSDKFNNALSNAKLWFDNHMLSLNLDKT